MSSPPSHSPLRTIALAGVVVGILDGLEAVIFNSLRGVPVARLFQFISSALLGPASRSYGAWSVALGVVLHFAVAFCLTIVFYALVARWPRMFDRWFWTGVAYGLASYIAMNYAILPVTRVMRPTGLFPPWPLLVNNVLAHVFCVGLPMAWVFKRAMRSRSSSMEVGPDRRTDRGGQ